MDGSHCGNDGGCPGHFGGKFSTCLDDAVHALSLDQSAAEWTGDVDAHGHFSLLEFAEPHSYAEGGGSAPWVVIPAGFYIVAENGQGHVYVTRYDSEAEARKVFDEAEAAYSEWLGDDL